MNCRSLLAASLLATAWPGGRLAAAPATLDSLLHNSPFGGGQALAAANRADSPLEFRGVLVEGGEQFFSLYEVSTHSSLWVGLNEAGNPYKVQAYDANKGELTVEYRNRVFAVALKQSKIVAQAPLPVAPPAPNGQPPGGIQNIAATTPAEEAARLSAVAEEIRRRRALRSAPPQPVNPALPPAQGPGPRPVRN